MTTSEEERENNATKAFQVLLNTLERTLEKVTEHGLKDEIPNEIARDIAEGIRDGVIEASDLMGFNDPPPGGAN